MAPKRRNAGQWASKMLKKLGGIFVKILPAYHIARVTSQTQTIKLQRRVGKIGASHVHRSFLVPRATHPDPAERTLKTTSTIRLLHILVNR